MASTDSNSDDLDAGWDADEKDVGVIAPATKEALRRPPSVTNLQKAQAVPPKPIAAKTIPAAKTIAAPKPELTQRPAASGAVTQVPAPAPRPGFRLRPAAKPIAEPAVTNPTPVPEAHSEAQPLSAGDVVTIRPPMPDDEYVRQMMGQAPESEMPPIPRIPRMPEYRGSLATLLEEEPLRYDIHDAPSSRGAAPATVAAPHVIAQTLDRHGAAPSIEMDEVGIDDLDPELLRETPIPPRPPIDSMDEFDELPRETPIPARAPIDSMDELDDLPVDEALRTAGITPFRNELSMERSRDEPYHQAVHDVPMQVGEIRSSQTDESTIEISYDEVDDEGDRPTMLGDDPVNKVGPIKDRFVLGDYSGALVLAEALLDEEPGNASALDYAESCREMLRQMYLSRLGEGSFVPRLLMEQEQLRWLTLDHRAGFLLACIDGSSSVDEILDVCGMPSLDALRTMYELLQQGAISVEPPPTVRR